MLLGGRLRDPGEKQVISEVISKHFKRKISEEQLFGFNGSSGSITTQEILSSLYSHSLTEFSHLVWTDELLQMAVLVQRAKIFDEPVLLVGSTGYVNLVITCLFVIISLFFADVGRQPFVSFYLICLIIIYSQLTVTCIPKLLTF